MEAELIRGQRMNRQTGATNPGGRSLTRAGLCHNMVGGMRPSGRAQGIPHGSNHTQDGRHQSMLHGKQQGRHGRCQGVLLRPRQVQTQHGRLPQRTLGGSHMSIGHARCHHIPQSNPQHIQHGRPQNTPNGATRRMIGRGRCPRIPQSDPQQTRHTQRGRPQSSPGGKAKWISRGRCHSVPHARPQLIQSNCGSIPSGRAKGSHHGRCWELRQWAHQRSCHRKRRCPDHLVRTQE